MSTGAGDAGAAEAPREIELKLELDPHDAARLGETSLVRGVQGRAEALSLKAYREFAETKRFWT